MKELLEAEHSVRIVSQNGRTHLILDGEDISKSCLGYTLRQCGGGKGSIELQLWFHCDVVDVEAEGVVKKE